MTTALKNGAKVIRQNVVKLSKTRLFQKLDDAAFRIALLIFGAIVIGFIFVVLLPQMVFASWG